MEEKKCPYCGEIIKVEAKKCRFCGEWVDAREDIVNSENNKESSVLTEEKVAWYDKWYFKVPEYIFLVGMLFYIDEYDVHGKYVARYLLCFAIIVVYDIYSLIKRFAKRRK